jgi:hypothetical protein
MCRYQPHRRIDTKAGPQMAAYNEEIGDGVEIVVGSVKYLTSRIGQYMAITFVKNFKKLKKCVLRTDIHGKWRELKNQQMQYRTDDGAVLNWSKSSGTVWFQGQKPAIPKFKRAFIKVATNKGLLEGAGDADGEIADLSGVISEIAKLTRRQKRMRAEIAELKETVGGI